MSRTSLHLAVLLVIAAVVCAPRGGASSEERPAHRFVPEAAACFCPSDHATLLIGSRDELEEMLGEAPCSSRGEGAEERARQWSDRCRQRVAASEIDFDQEALFYIARFFSSGMIKGSLEISGPEDGVLTVAVRVHTPDGPLTPDLGFLGAALALDKSRVQQIRTDDGRGNQLIIDVK